MKRHRTLYSLGKRPCQTSVMQRLCSWKCNWLHALFSTCESCSAFTAFFELMYNVRRWLPRAIVLTACYWERNKLDLVVMPTTNSNTPDIFKFTGTSKKWMTCLYINEPFTIILAIKQFLKMLQHRLVSFMRHNATSLCLRQCSLRHRRVTWRKLSYVYAAERQVYSPCQCRGPVWWHDEREAQVRWGLPRRAIWQSAEWRSGVAPSPDSCRGVSATERRRSDRY
jgi:hypothetical protein